MSRHVSSGDPPPDPIAIVRMLLLRETDPVGWAKTAGRWERLIRNRQWKYAEPLMVEDAELVSLVVERLVGAPSGRSSDADAWFCLGMVRKARGNRDGATVALGEALKRRPRDRGVADALADLSP